MTFNQEVSLMEFLLDLQFAAKLVGYCKEPLCLVMKYYPLGDLTSYTKTYRQAVTKSKRLKLSIISDIAQGIKGLHGRLVAHADLKPQNVLVDQLPDRVQCVLTDFGISKILTEEYLASKAFQIVNLKGLTIPYAAPDVLQRFRRKGVFGRPEEEKAGDLYSFGMIIYFILCLEDPWSRTQ
jgi:serine/threonine protein kinase